MLFARKSIVVALVSVTFLIGASAAHAQAKSPHETWFVELGVSLNARNHDGYNRALKQQGYERDLDLSLPLSPELAFGAALHRYVSMLVRYDFLESNTYRKTSGSSQVDTFEWTTRSVSLAARGRLPLYDEWLVAFAELSCGLGIARPRDTVMGKETEDHQFGPALRGALGLAFGSEHFGGYLVGAYTHVSILEKSGQQHQDGGPAVALGLRVRSLRWWW